MCVCEREGAGGDGSDLCIGYDDLSLKTLKKVTELTSAMP
jgi:hypothetical protein